MTRHVVSTTSGIGRGASLVVVLHGCTWSSSRRGTQLRHVLSAIREAIPDADILTPEMPIEFWSLQSAEHIVHEVVAEIDRVWNERSKSDANGYERLLLVGFSFGSVLIRRVFCEAAGATDKAEIDAAAVRPWVGRVSRMVLIAGLNRGWTVDSPVTRLESVANNLGTAIGHLLPKKPTLFSIRRGAPFLTLTRLQWLALSHAGVLPQVTVQLLGTRDDIVSPTDNIDLVTGSDFVYLEVPRSGHFEVVQMDARTEDGLARRHCFQAALTGSREELARRAVDLSDVVAILPAGAEASAALGLVPERPARVDDVVFVVHGIRDKGYWTRKIARVVATRARGLARRVVTVTPSYGYFAMLPFLCPWTRRAKVEWLLDLYVAVRAWHPQARISFVGHSNGTYILSDAIASCPAVRFDRIVFAGSVVRTDFAWRDRQDAGQVDAVLNYVATSDWVVAIFPRLLEILQWQDLGGAGFEGFRSQGAQVANIRYVRGYHSAALDEQHWSDIATFVLGGASPQPRAIAPKRNRIVEALAHGAVLVWLLIAGLIAVPTYLMLSALDFPSFSGQWWWALALLLWVRFVTAVLTRL